eukprot:TRINITY_DN7635_c0_g1_i1.p1 TRINITY_DN7635_c0_g1~~TRINITY_DN7635_c0_g1_i1.p1  ORF type:complete len:557 (+),score=152.89 TRINITY_DN7635_c0_g1_i1:1247-2917(+)
MKFTKSWLIVEFLVTLLPELYHQSKYFLMSSSGQQRITLANAFHTSTTIEMADLNRKVDVAVIDEIQMIGDEQRGWAWTRALLGLLANEIHVCGDPSALDVVQKIGEIIGENVEVRNYARLSPLVPVRTPFHNYHERLQKGDCVIAFSKKDIYRIKSSIEKNSKVKCCVVYGSLPPEARRQQAELFNSPDSGYDVLVASDAIGMGLNLNIRRILFSSMAKFDGKDDRLLHPLEVRQIAGRAGRFSGKFPKGEAHCLNSDDSNVMISALNKQVQPIKAAGLFPTFDQLAKFLEKKRGLPFSALLDSFSLMTKLDMEYFLCDYSMISQIARLIEHIPMTLDDRYTFCTSPAPKGNMLAMSSLLDWAQEFAAGKRVPVEIQLPGQYQASDHNEKSRLDQLEEIYGCCDLYLWLALRFPSEFYQQNKANEMKEKCSLLIDELLERMGVLNKYKRRQENLQERGQRARPSSQNRRRSKMFFRNGIEEEEGDGDETWVNDESDWEKSGSESEDDADRAKFSKSKTPNDRPLTKKEKRDIKRREIKQARNREKHFVREAMSRI